jgi:glycosyltransferase involved in cell wall biosynthesis
MARIVVLSRRSVANPLSGGAGRYVHEIFRRLTPRHSITVLSGGASDCNPVEVIDGITYRQFPGAFHRILLPIRYVSKFARKTDLLIDNSDVGIPWLSPLYSRIPRITIIHQLVREIFYDELPRPISDLGFTLEPMMYRLYSKSKIVAASQSTASDLILCGIPRRNIDVIEPGCPNPGLPVTSLSERSPKTIGCVSRLMKYKGLQLALKSLSKVAKGFPDIQLLVAGSGPYQEDLSRLSVNLGISKNVHFLGRVSEQSKFKLYGQTRLAIYPSFREGFGISVIEANSVGTPVVGWDVPGSRDSIIDGRTGLLAPFPDESAFADRICTLLTDDQAWHNLSESASKWALDHSWDKSAKDFENVVLDALEGR